MRCSPEELRSDIVVEYSEEIVGQLRTELASDIKRMTEITLTKSLKYERFDVDIKKYYQSDKEKREVTILSAKTNLLPHIFFSFCFKVLKVKTLIKSLFMNG